VVLPDVEPEPLLEPKTKAPRSTRSNDGPIQSFNDYFPTPELIEVLDIPVNRVGSRSYILAKWRGDNNPSAEANDDHVYDWSNRTLPNDSHKVVTEDGAIFNKRHDSYDLYALHRGHYDRTTGHIDRAAALQAAMDEFPDWAKTLDSPVAGGAA
jgi:hypothetical protein